MLYQNKTWDGQPWMNEADLDQARRRAEVETPPPALGQKKNKCCKHRDVHIKSISAIVRT